MKIFLNGLKKKNNFIFFLILIFSLNLNSQVIITGISSSYIGDELKLYKVSDRITYTKEIIAKSKVDSLGRFEFVVNLDKIERVYIDLPTIKAFMYVEPNKKYEIRIPSKIEKTEEQFLNPYFTKKTTPIYIIKPPQKDINLLLIYYNSFLNKHKEFILKQSKNFHKKQYFDSIKIEADTFLNYIDNQYFSYYKKTEFLYVRHYFVQYNKDFFIDSVFSKLPVLHNSASYMALFNRIFDMPFKTENSMLPLNYVYTGIKNHNLELIKDSLMSTYPSFSEEFAELLAIKGLYDKFYEVEKTQEDIIYTLKQVSKNDVYDFSFLVINNILKEVLKLRKGSVLPEIILPNKKEKNININKYKNEFVYLQFFHPQSFDCIQQLAVLKKYQEQKIKKLNIVSIFVGDDIEQMKVFLNKNKEYKWDFLFAEKESKILEDYNVNIYPTYFLIDPEGKLSVQKTPTPIDNFEQIYNNQYKKWFKK